MVFTKPKPIYYMVTSTNSALKRLGPMKVNLKGFRSFLGPGPATAGPRAKRLGAWWRHTWQCDSGRFTTATATGHCAAVFFRCSVNGHRRQPNCGNCAEVLADQLRGAQCHQQQQFGEVRRAESEELIEEEFATVLFHTSYAA